MSVNLRQKLDLQETILGSWYSLTDPAAMEILSQSPFDFLLVDGEHTHIGEAHLPELLRAAKGNHTAIVYRVRENSEGLIKMALDLGVDGLFVPQVNDAAAAQRAVAAAKYPPLGNRGVGPHRVSNYYEDVADYYATANEINTLILQIEHIDAVAALDEILTVQGYDALFIGPADLSASMGHFPNTGHPELLAVIEQIVAKCVAANMPVGIDAASSAQIRALAAQGMQIFTFGMDIFYLKEGAAATAKLMRDALQG